jgi:hypothetical protein
MLRRIVQMVLLVAVLGGSVALAQTSQRMWYRGPFEGWVDTSNRPAYGYYYHPSPDSAYPLNESSYGRPIPCNKCGHMHYPGRDVCPRCGQECTGGGNNLDPRTVYSPYRLPGAYYYEEQPHYRFASPMRLGGTYRKYTRPYD